MYIFIINESYNEIRERVIERRPILVVNVSKNQFRFIFGKLIV